MKYNSIKVLMALATIPLQVEGVIPDFAMVRSHEGLKPMIEVVEGEEVLSADIQKKELVQGVVVSNQPRSRRNSTIQIDLGIRTINAAPDQVLFDPSKSEWFRAEELTEENILLGEEMDHQEIVGVKRISHSPMFTRAVGVAATHQLFVDGVLNHNMWSFIQAFALDSAEKYAKVTARELVSDGLHVVAGRVGGTWDNGRDGRGESWYSDARHNAQMVQDHAGAASQQIYTPADIAIGNNNVGPSPFPAINRRREAIMQAGDVQIGDGFIKAGSKPITIRCGDHLVALQPGDTYVSGFGKMEIVDTSKPAAAGPVPAPQKPAAAPQKPAAAPQKPASEPNKPAAAPRAPVAKEESKDAPHEVVATKSDFIREVHRGVAGDVRSGFDSHQKTCDEIDAYRRQLREQQNNRR